MDDPEPFGAVLDEHSQRFLLQIGGLVRKDIELLFRQSCGVDAAAREQVVSHLPAPGRLAWRKVEEISARPDSRRVPVGVRSGSAVGIGGRSLWLFGL